MQNINFTSTDWERIERDTMAWWAGELHRPLVWLTNTDPLALRKPFDFLSNYSFNISVEEIIAIHTPWLAKTHFYGDAFPWWWINFGPGILAGFLGANVNSVAEPSETVWFTPKHKVDLPDLSPIFNPDNIWWKRIKELTTAIVDYWDGMVAVSHTDLGGNLDVIASLLDTQALLVELIERPDDVLQQVSRITLLWQRYYAELDAIIRPKCRGTTAWTPIWSTGTTYMLQCDFAYMISPAMFEKFVMPDLTAQCNYLSHAFYHLDGIGQIPHIDLLLSISNLCGIQWIPGDGQPSPDQWLALLKRIRDGNKLCQVFVTPEGARTIVKHLGGRGFLLVISNEHNQFTPERAAAFLNTLSQEDISQNP